MSLNAGTRLGPYEIVSPLGAGGMGEVYRARDSRLERDVAVKVLPASFASDAERLRRFEQEARAVAALNHPNILAVYDIGTHEGAPYLVSELLEGETLRERLGGGALPARKVIDYAVQAAHGLAAAHEKGIVHRDLKPENVFVTKDGRVKILDFGLAKLTATEGAADSASLAPTSPSMTDPGMVLGTVGYMSPEQVRGKPADQRSDIFSLGAILYELLTGQRAFRRDSSIETLNAILKEEPPELSTSAANISPALERAVNHCLEKSPEQRFQSASDLAFNLEAISGISTTSQAQKTIPVEASRKWLWLAVGAVVLLASYAAVFFLGKQTASFSSPSFQRLAFRRGTVSSARFTSDGQTILYGASFGSNPLHLFSTRPDSPESRSAGLPDKIELMSISSSGELAVLLNANPFGAAFAETGTLARVPLAGGAPREILDKVTWADWGPDGKQLAVVHGVDSKSTLEFPLGKVLYQTQGWIGDPRVSPDGTMVAFLDHPIFNDDEGAVAVVDLAGKKKTLTENWVSVRGLAWSPSGKEVWFTASSVGANRALYGVTLSGKVRLVYRVDGSLHLMDTAPSGQVLLVDENERYEMMGREASQKEDRDLSWFDWSLVGDLSSDGKWALFTEGGEGGGPSYSVYMRGLDGLAAVRLGDGSGMAISPDGKWVLSGDPHKLPEQIVLLPTGAGEQRQITNDSINHTGAGWFPDGKRIIFLGNETGHGPRLYVQDLNGGRPRAITPEGFVSNIHAVSPDGKRVYARQISDGQWMMFPAEGGKPQPISGTNKDDVIIQWTRDGKSLYVADYGNPAKVFRLSLATGKREPWKELEPSDPSGVGGIGPIHITPDGKSYVYSLYRDLCDLYLVKGLK
jgi:serine/threonine protein kinase/Tol biopolymer transport system component